MSYYLVKCKFGHVGRDKYLPLVVPVNANSAKEASEIARKKGGVKRDHKDWCLEGPVEVSFEDYIKAIDAYESDVYFEKHSRSRLYLFEDRLVEETNYTRINGIKTNTAKFIRKRSKESAKHKLMKEKEIIQSLIKEEKRIMLKFPHFFEEVM